MIASTQLDKPRDNRQDWAVTPRVNFFNIDELRIGLKGATA
jgi:hypothetical protein